SSLQAIAAAAGQPLPLYTATLVSSPPACPQMSSTKPLVEGAVHVNHTSCAMPVVPDALQAALPWPCEPVVAAALLNAKGPKPLIDWAVVQLSDPCPKDVAESVHRATRTRR